MKRWLGLLLALVTIPAMAAQKCYEWRYNSSLPWVKDPGAAASAYVGTIVPTGSASSNGAWNHQMTDLAVVNTGFPGFSFRYSFTNTGNCSLPSGCTSNDGVSSVMVLANREAPGGCPSCPAAGSKQSLSGDGGIGAIPASTCKNGCEFKQKGSRVAGRFGGGTQAWVADYESSGAACGSDAGNSTTPATNAENAECDATGAICIDKGAANKNCGIYNGNRVCVQSVPPGGCVGYADGGAACRGSGGNEPATPPAPNNGTPGEPAEADATVGAGGNTVNYYSSTTVSGSSSAPTTGAPNSGTVSNPTGSVGGEDGDGDGEPDGNGSGEGGGGDLPVTCVGPGCNAGTPALEEIGTLPDAFGGFWSDLQEVPIVAASSGVSASFGSGACPQWSDSINVYGQSWDMDFSSMCATWSGLAPILSVVMLVFWGFIAFRILFSA